MNNITIFSNAEFGQIRTLTGSLTPDASPEGGGNPNGDVWFVGKDVAEILGYQNPSVAIAKKVDDEDKMMIMIDSPTDFQNGNLLRKTKTAFINESGLYYLIFASKLPAAKRFKHWVTSEVLPQIRKTGGYISLTPGPSPEGEGRLSDDEVMMRAMAVAQKTIDMKNQLIGDLRPKAEYCENVLLSPSCYTMTQIAKDLSMTVYELEHRLHAMGVIYRSQSGPFMLYAKHLGKGYEAYRTSHGKEGHDGFEWTDSYLVWTEKGREFVHSIIGLHRAHICTADEIKN